MMEYDRVELIKASSYPKPEIADNDYDLSINRYKEVDMRQLSMTHRKKFSNGWRSWRKKIEGEELEKILNSGKTTWGDWSEVVQSNR